MAGRFRHVQERFGPGSVGVISTGQLVTEEFYALGKLVQLGLGTSNYDGNTTLCMSTAVVSVLMTILLLRKETVFLSRSMAHKRPDCLSPYQNSLRISWVIR